MKKTLFVIALAVALTFMFAAAAFADHSPNFYVEWSKTATFTGYAESFGNLGKGSPHQNYLEGTEKCGVCHAVHRAPVFGVSWDTSQTNPAVKTPVAGGQYNRQEFDNSFASIPATTTAYLNSTQMLLQTDVAQSCDYCHILTAIGGDQLYAGKPSLRTGEWNEGFAHGNACTACHAVHGVSANYATPALWGNYGTFQGPIKSKVLKVRAKGSGGAVGSAAEYNWQDETVAIGSLGKAEYAASGISGAAAWAAAQTAADYAGGVRVNYAVDRLNVPLFPSPTDAINGTLVRPDASAYDAQSGVFCTFCHQNYGYASEATVNPDGDRSLFQGPWYALAGVVPNVTGTAGTWQTMNGASGYGAPFKNHPVKAVYGTFDAAGKSATVPAQVAFANASTCVSCHDAGLNRPVDSQTGVFIESYPHFTPGYFHFVKSAANMGATMANGPVELGLIPNRLNAGDPALATVQAWLEDTNNYDESTTVQDGQCLKCHVEDSNPLGRGIGKTF
jgi:hypothetical protein